GSGVKKQTHDADAEKSKMISFSVRACYSYKKSDTPHLEEFIQQYAAHLRSERSVRGHTLRNYLSDLTQLSRFLIEKGLCLNQDGAVDVRKIDIYVVRAYLASLTKDRKKSSIGRK